jgi:hypothetical protein
MASELLAGQHNIHSKPSFARTECQVELTVPEIDRFWSKVARGAKEECWLWLAGKKTSRLYGRVEIRRDGRRAVRIAAHRLTWTLINGPIPTGAVVCHRCDCPRCCNPTHLFLGTQKENIDDASAKGRLPGKPKLTRSQVLEIRALSAQGVRRSAIARRFGLGDWTVGKIVTRRTWRHLPDNGVMQNQSMQTESRLRNFDIPHQLFKPVRFVQLPIVGDVR